MPKLLERLVAASQTQERDVPDGYDSALYGQHDGTSVPRMPGRYAPNMLRVFLLAGFEVPCELVLDTIVECARGDERHVDRTQLHHVGCQTNKRASVACQQTSASIDQ